VVLYRVPAAVRPARDYRRDRRRAAALSAALTVVGLALAAVLVAVN
jgi:hypothetical protein